MTFANFCNTYNQKLLTNSDAGKAFLFLSDPYTISNLITFTDMKLPAISGVGAILEKTFNNTTTFTMENPHNRQMIGKMVKFILSFFGYETEINGLEERAQLRQFSNCTFFKTAAVYHKKNTPALKQLVITIQ